MIPTPVWHWLYTHVSPSLALAQFVQDWQTGTSEFTCVYGNSRGVATIQGFRCLIGNVLSVAMTVIGLVGFVMLIYGSFRFMLSGGQSEGIKKARGTITFVVAGIVLALSAFVILNLIAQFTGVQNITNFNLTV